VAASNLLPGGGAFVQGPKGGAAFTVTFVGEVPQGPLSTTLVAGFQIVSSQVPQAGKMQTDLGYNPDGGDKIYQWNATSQNYGAFTFDSAFGWDPSEPTLDVGEAVFLSKDASAKNLAWTRTFSVNQ